MAAQERLDGLGLNVADGTSVLGFFCLGFGRTPISNRLVLVRGNVLPLDGYFFSTYGVLPLLC